MITTLTKYKIISQIIELQNNIWYRFNTLCFTKHAHIWFHLPVSWKNPTLWIKIREADSQWVVTLKPVLPNQCACILHAALTMVLSDLPETNMPPIWSERKVKAKMLATHLLNLLVTARGKLSKHEPSSEPPATRLSSNVVYT